MALNLKQGDGRAALHRLPGSADIVLENYGPGTMDRLGCGWQQLRELNPRLVYLALKGYLSGPYILRKMDFSLVPLVLGLLLGMPMEKSLRRALTAGSEDCTVLVASPLSVALYLITASVPGLAVYFEAQRIRRQRRERREKEHLSAEANA